MRWEESEPAPPSRDAQSGRERRPEPDSWDLAAEEEAGRVRRVRGDPRRVPEEATPGPSGRSAPPFYSSHCDPSVPLQLVASLSLHLPFPLPRALSPRLIPPPTFPGPRLASPPSGVPSAVASSQRPSQTSTAQVTSLPQPRTHV